MNNVAEHAREQKAGMKCPQSILSLAFEHRPHEVESSF